MEPSFQDEVRVGIAHSDAACEILGTSDIDYVEIPVERLMHDGSTLDALGDVPCILHCSSLSIAGTVPPSDSMVSAVGQWVRATGTPWIGEHLAFITAGQGSNVYDVGFTISPVMSEDAVERVAAAVDHWTRVFGLPILLENSPMYFSLPGSTMTQAAFFQRVCAASPAGLLLDLTHFLISARNLDRDPHAELEEFPLERVVEVHLSGLTCQSGVWWDDHASAAPAEVFELLARLAPRAPRLRAVTLEYNWDPFFPRLTIDEDLGRARNATGG